jgi:Helix-turn-helix domain
MARGYRTPGIERYLPLLDGIDFQKVSRLLGNLPEAITAERERRGLTIKAAAEQAGVGHSTWSQLERRERVGFSFPIARAIFVWLASSTVESR